LRRTLHSKGPERYLIDTDELVVVVESIAGSDGSLKKRWAGNLKFG
jgi:hypothetical protein